ncbi:hypothetical protein [Streptomyces pinistramenti]|uniref:hypothetical protein n=1 Tax=Streptomyces pinistramenti TaxID=2884812 RepID=UPI001D094157|nr:hypothetical protein [Streptomyces pinistramenti]MCB5910358.1 hypothetical protein [Streptomyces pinistramenti]
MSVQHIALVLEASGLCAQEKAVLTAMCNHTDPAGKTFAGEERLMRESGMPKSTFRRWRAQLVDRNLLISRRKGRTGGGRATSDTWVNLEALRAARDPFFGTHPTDRPEDENPFAAAQSNGLTGETKGGGNGLTSETINSLASETTVVSPVRPQSLSNPQSESLSPQPPSPGAVKERENDEHQDDKQDRAPSAPPVPRQASPAGSDETTEAGERADEIGYAWARARKTHGYRAPADARRRIASAARGLLVDGDDPADAAQLEACAVAMAREASWLDLAKMWLRWEPDAAARPVLPKWCGRCNDGMDPGPSASMRLIETNDAVRPCPDCHPGQVVARTEGTPDPHATAAPLPVA